MRSILLAITLTLGLSLSAQLAPDEVKAKVDANTPTLQIDKNEGKYVVRGAKGELLGDTTINDVNGYVLKSESNPVIIVSKLDMPNGIPFKKQAAASWEFYGDRTNSTDNQIDKVFAYDPDNGHSLKNGETLYLYNTDATKAENGVLGVFTFASDVTLFIVKPDAVPAVNAPAAAADTDPQAQGEPGKPEKKDSGLGIWFWAFVALLVLIAVMAYLYVSKTKKLVAEWNKDKPDGERLDPKKYNSIFPLVKSVFDLYDKQSIKSNRDNNTADELTRQLDKAKQSYKSLISERDNYANDVKSLKREVEQARNKVTDLTVKLTLACDELNAEKAKHAKALEDANAASSNSAAAGIEMQKQLKIAESKIDELRESLAAAEKQIEENNKAIEEKDRVLKNMDQRLADLTEEYNLAKAKADKYDTIAGKIEETTKIVVEKKKKQLDEEYKDKFDSLNTEIDRLKVEIGNRESAANDAAADHQSKLEEAAKAHKAAIDALKEANVLEIKAIDDKHKEDVAALNIAHDNYTKQLDEAHRREIQNIRDEQKLIVRELEEKIDDLTGKLAAIEDRHHAETANIKKYYDDQIDILKSSHADKLASISLAHKQEIDDIKARNESDIQALKQAGKIATENLEAKINELQEKLALPRKMLTGEMTHEIDLIGGYIDKLVKEASAHDTGTTTYQLVSRISDGFASAKAEIESVFDQITPDSTRDSVIASVLDNARSWINMAGWVNYASLLAAYMQIPQMAAVMAQQGVDSRCIADLFSHTASLMGKIGITLIVPNILVDAFSSDVFDAANRQTTIDQINPDIHPRDYNGVVYDMYQIGFIINGSETQKPKVKYFV